MTTAGAVVIRHDGDDLMVADEQVGQPGQLVCRVWYSEDGIGGNASAGTCKAAKAQVFLAD